MLGTMAAIEFICIGPLMVLRWVLLEFNVSSGFPSIFIEMCVAFHRNAKQLFLHFNKIVFDIEIQWECQYWQHLMNLMRNMHSTLAVLSIQSFTFRKEKKMQFHWILHSLINIKKIQLRPCWISWKLNFPLEKPRFTCRFARYQMDETYENSSQFDITFLMLVWLAFVPCVISPCIYACWIMPE